MSLKDTTHCGIDAGNYGMEQQQVDTDVNALVMYLTSTGYKKYAQVLHVFKAEKTGGKMLMVQPVNIKNGKFAGGVIRIHKSAVVHNAKIGDADSDQEEELEKELEQVLDQEPVPEPEPEPTPATTGATFAKGDWIEFKKEGEEIRKGKITQDGRVLLVEDGSSSVAVSVYPNEVIGKCTDPNEPRTKEGEEAKKGEEQDEEKDEEQAEEQDKEQDEEQDEEPDEEQDEEQDEEGEASIAARDLSKVAFFERLVNLMKSAPEKEVAAENKDLATATFEKYTSEPGWSDEDAWTVLGKLTTKKYFKKMVERTLLENKDISFPEELYMQVGKKRSRTTYDTNTAGKKQKALLAPEDESASEHDDDDDNDGNAVADESGDPEKTSVMVDALLPTTLEKCKKFPNYYPKRGKCRAVNSLLIDIEAGVDTNTPYQKLAAFVNEKLPDKKQKAQNKLAAILYLMLATPCPDYTTLSQALKYVKESDSGHVMAFLCLKVLNKPYQVKAVRKLVLEMHTTLVRLAA